MEELKEKVVEIENRQYIALEDVESYISKAISSKLSESSDLLLKSIKEIENTIASIEL